MQKIWIMVLLLSVAVTFGCGKSSGNKAADTYLSGMNDIATAVEKVDDEDSAKKAIDVIGKVREKMERVAEDLENMSEAEKQALEQKYADEFAEAQARLTSSMQKLMMKPHLMGIISEEMSKLPDLR